jgi:hypothetical protein
MQLTAANKASARFYSPAGAGRKQQNSSGVKIVIGALSCMIIVGVFFAAFLTPVDSDGGPGVNSVKVDNYLLDFIHNGENMYGNTAITEALPDWNIEFWTPIDIDVTADPMVVLCKLNFKKQWMEPHNSPMFKDLVGVSTCLGTNRKRERMSVLLNEIKALSGQPSGRVIPPTGFVFHESRVGSTLVANMLATDPWALVFSESAPVANAIMHCGYCSSERKLQLFRDVLTLMGRSPFHKRLYVKFQSITSTKMEIALQAFPNTAWAFVFRQPVQTMMSHLDPLKGGGAAAPCLRSKRSPPSEVSHLLLLLYNTSLIDLLHRLRVR